MNTNIFRFQNMNQIRIWINSVCKIKLNTNTFSLQNQTKYEYIQFENLNWIRVRILFGFWKAPINSVFKYFQSELFEYIQIPNYLLTSAASLVGAGKENLILSPDTM